LHQSAHPFAQAVKLAHPLVHRPNAQVVKLAVFVVTTHDLKAKYLKELLATDTVTRGLQLLFALVIGLPLYCAKRRHLMRTDLLIFSFILVPLVIFYIGVLVMQVSMRCLLPDLALPFALPCFALLRLASPCLALPRLAFRPASDIRLTLSLTSAIHRRVLITSLQVSMQELRDNAMDGS
jgi:hypothetical protein